MVDIVSGHFFQHVVSQAIDYRLSRVTSAYVAAFFRLDGENRVQDSLRSAITNGEICSSGGGNEKTYETFSYYLFIW
jgi:hypothetical protein